MKVECFNIICIFNNEADFCLAHKLIIIKCSLFHLKRVWHFFEIIFPLYIFFSPKYINTNILCFVLIFMWYKACSIAFYYNVSQCH